MQMVDILNTFYERTHANNLHFHVFFVPVASAMVSDFALSFLRTVNEQTAKC